MKEFSLKPVYKILKKLEKLNTFYFENESFEKRRRRRFAEASFGPTKHNLIDFQQIGARETENLAEKKTHNTHWFLKKWKYRVCQFLHRTGGSWYRPATLLSLPFPLSPLPVWLEVYALSMHTTTLSFHTLPSFKWRIGRVSVSLIVCYVLVPASLNWTINRIIYLFKYLSILLIFVFWIDLKISEDEAVEILRVVSGRTGLDKIENGSRPIVNGTTNSLFFTCWNVALALQLTGWSWVEFWNVVKALDWFRHLGSSIVFCRWELF